MIPAERPNLAVIARYEAVVRYIEGLEATIERQRPVIEQLKDFDPDGLERWAGELSVGSQIDVQELVALQDTLLALAGMSRAALSEGDSTE